MKLFKKLMVAVLALVAIVTAGGAVAHAEDIKMLEDGVYVTDHENSAVEGVVIEEGVVYILVKDPETYDDETKQVFQTERMLSATEPATEDNAEASEESEESAEETEESEETEETEEAPEEEQALLLHEDDKYAEYAPMYVELVNPDVKETDGHYYFRVFGEEIIVLTPSEDGKVLVDYFNIEHKLVEDPVINDTENTEEVSEEETTEESTEDEE